MKVIILTKYKNECPCDICISIHDKLSNLPTSIFKLQVDLQQKVISFFHDGIAFTKRYNLLDKKLREIGCKHIHTSTSAYNYYSITEEYFFYLRLRLETNNIFETEL